MSSGDPHTLHANINWHSVLIAIQISHAKKVKGRARSGYYKMATILGATITEGLVHAILRKKIGANGVILTGKKVPYECYPLPKKFLNGESELVICKRRDEKIELKNNPDFSVLNNTCLKEKLFSKRTYNNVENVRKMRNKIHLQGLDHIDRSYTKTNVEKIARTINSLVTIYVRP